jgi:hypothetical protein
MLGGAPGTFPTDEHGVDSAVVSRATSWCAASA